MTTIPFVVTQPTGIDLLVDRVTYKRDWTFSIRADAGQFARWLSIKIYVDDSRTGLPLLVDHWLSIPYEPLWSDAEWERWLLDQVLLVERHEACEFFAVDGERIFYPEHGGGGQPYRIERKTA